MSERIRGSLFNIIQGDLKQARVLDAFAGTGVLGIEAISRGAKEAVFIERDLKANKILSENVKKIKIENFTNIYKMGVKHL